MHGVTEIVCLDIELLLAFYLDGLEGILYQKARMLCHLLATRGRDSIGQRQLVSLVSFCSPKPLPLAPSRVV